MWCWRRLLRVPWTAKRYNQSILKEISPEYSLEGLMLKLKLQYFGHLMGRTDSFEKTLMLGKIEGRKRRGWQRMRWLDGITNSMDMSWSRAGDGQGGLVCCSPWGSKELDTIEWLNWTELKREYRMRNVKELRKHFSLLFGLSLNLDPSFWYFGLTFFDLPFKSLKQMSPISRMTQR